jgi:hypothetical protein
LVAPRERIVIVDREPAEQHPVLGAQRGQLGPILRVREVIGARLEDRDERRIVEPVLEEVGDMVDLSLGEPRPR